MPAVVVDMPAGKRNNGRQPCAIAHQARAPGPPGSGAFPFWGRTASGICPNFECGRPVTDRDMAVSDNLICDGECALAASLREIRICSFV